MNTVDVEITIKRRERRRPKEEQPEKDCAPSIPRISRLMALAITSQDMVDRGEVRDYADLARLGFVTRARLTQIMNLTLLEPDIQEEILGLRQVTCAPIFSERHVRSVIKFILWEHQRQAWRQPCRARGPSD
jgi:hypothetical protein